MEHKTQIKMEELRHTPKNVPHIANELACGRGYYHNPEPHWAKVFRFLNGYQLQCFCNNPDNGITDGCLIHIAVGRGNQYYLLSNGEAIDDFRVTLDMSKSMIYFKGARTAVQHGTRQFYSVMCFVYKNEKGYWKASIILEDGDELYRKKVTEAFAKITGDEVNAIELTVAEFTLYKHKTFGWLYNKGEKYWICLPDGGQIMEVEASEVKSIKPVDFTKRRVIITPYNVYDVFKNNLEKLQ